MQRYVSLFLFDSGLWLITTMPSSQREGKGDFLVNSGGSLCVLQLN